MIPYLLIHADIAARETKAQELITEAKLTLQHPDVLWLGEEEKLGIEQARKIQQFLSLKPYQGSNQAVVLLSADNLTPEAQNALLKTLEETHEQAVIILGISSDEQLLPTILSRCQIINLEHSSKIKAVNQKYDDQIVQLINQTVEQRFQFIEKMEDREYFLTALAAYFRQQLLQKPHQKQLQEYLKTIMEAELWAKHNVNIRAILEYLMLKMPSSKK